MIRHLLIASAVLVSATGASYAQDAAAGEKVFAVCKACHQIGENAKNLVGPNLNGVIGRAAGTVAGFNYSDANKKSGITWDEATFKEYIAGPEGQGSRHEDVLCRSQGPAEGQRPRRLPEAVRRGRQKEVSRASTGTGPASALALFFALIPARGMHGIAAGIRSCGIAPHPVLLPMGEGTLARRLRYRPLSHWERARGNSPCSVRNQALLCTHEERQADSNAPAKPPG